MSEAFSYSRAKYEAAPERTLTPEEQKYLQDWADQVDQLAGKLIRESGQGLGKGLLALTKNMFDPQIWKLLLNKNKLDTLTDKLAGSKEGQLNIAESAAIEMNEEYDRRARAVVDAVNSLEDFIKEVNGR